MKVGDLVRHKNIPSFGAGLVVGRNRDTTAYFLVEWLDPNKTTCRKTQEVSYCLEVINENN